MEHRVGELEQQLAAATQDISDITWAADRVQPRDLAKLHAEATAHAQDEQPVQVLSDLPAAMHEQRWLIPVSRTAEIAAPEGCEGLTCMLAAASSMDAVIPKIGADRPADVEPALQSVCPRSWHDNAQPGHVNLRQERLAHRQKQLLKAADADLSKRLPSIFR